MMPQPLHDSDRPVEVLLVGYEDRDNLGLRYLLASLQVAGHSCSIVRYDSDPRSLVAVAKKRQPVLIGFSLIFQYMAPDFSRVITALREAGVGAHITIGGHYASFDYEKVLRCMPGLDSVVRFEGELTVCKLTERIKCGQDWCDIDGIAYRGKDEITSNPVRSPIQDLDSLPVPDRFSYDYESEAFPTAAILGSRGCPWDCSFCSIRPFYEAQGGALRRFRDPAAIVREMCELYRERQVSTFLFQDDDFLAGGRRAKEWACRMADELLEAGMAGNVVFKISCRSDEIDEETISHLMRGGLTHVYMGVEAGDEQDLLAMSKRITPEIHLAAGEVLKRLQLSFDFGFMLLQPYSTFGSVRNNIDFLETFVGDGWSVASFCRMLPYAGTPIKEQLVSEGRMLGTAFEPDYRFLDPKLDIFYDWMLSAFHERNFTSHGLSNILRAMSFEALLRLRGREQVPEASKVWLRHLTLMANRLAFYVLREAVNHIESRSSGRLDEGDAFLRDLCVHEHEQEAQLLGEVAELYASFPSQKHAANLEPTGLPGAFDKSWIPSASARMSSRSWATEEALRVDGQA